MIKDGLDFFYEMDARVACPPASGRERSPRGGTSKREPSQSMLFRVYAVRESVTISAPLWPSRAAAMRLETRSAAATKAASGRRM